MAKDPAKLLAEELKQDGRSFDKWLKNTGKDDRFVVTLLKIPLDGKSTKNGGIDDGNESKETSEGS